VCCLIGFDDVWLLPGANNALMLCKRSCVALAEVAIRPHDVSASRALLTLHRLARDHSGADNICLLSIGSNNS